MFEENTINHAANSSLDLINPNLTTIFEDTSRTPLTRYGFGIRAAMVLALRLYLDPVQVPWAHITPSAPWGHGPIMTIGPR